MCMCESWGTRSPLWGGLLAREWRDCPPVGCQSSFGRPSLAHSVACVQLDVRSVPSGLLMVAIGGPIPQTVDGGVETSAVPNAARAAGVVEISNAHDDDRRFARHADQAVATRSSHRASPFHRAQHARGCDQQVAHQPANSPAANNNDTTPLKTPLSSSDFHSATTPSRATCCDASNSTDTVTANIPA